MQDADALQSYRRVAWVTVAAVYFLILVGATVRASGAGMGCPDWPTCFGRWIPPVSEAQLPDNYQQIYADRGYAQTRFNPVKTWTEYVNRLVGVTIGLLIFLTAFKAWSCRRHDRWIFPASLAAFFMVAFQGWLGARVVASNLMPGMITLHMVMALAIVATLLFALARARHNLGAARPAVGLDRRFAPVLYVLIGMTIVQITMGTQVREMVDYLNNIQGEERSAWVSALPWVFYVHRSFSAVVLFTGLGLAWLTYRSLGWQHSLTRFAAAMAATLAVAVITGAALGHLGMPALVQPAHLLLASLLFGLQFLLWLDYRHLRRQGVVAWQ